MNGPLFIRTNSHRCRERITRIIGKPDYYWTWATAGCLILVTPEQYELVKGVTGVTRYSGKDKPARCW